VGLIYPLGGQQARRRPGRLGRRLLAGGPDVTVIGYEQVAWI
jgi:hypothetical protein